ncbi:MAG: hypothetical protein DME06_12690 [Candidatus Rokuibacteriota bacterium]|nr:MAG: hypothetical protein DME09_09870 [Candidatus Rokubacteria bacterium]PYN11119.1 MAG: hypothetical protein DME06_12690 [Candidatus Rokubacteria bacterium]
MRGIARPSLVFAGDRRGLGGPMAFRVPGGRGDAVHRDRLGLDAAIRASVPTVVGTMPRP